LIGNPPLAKRASLFDNIMGAHNHKGEYCNTLWNGDKLSQLLMLVILMPYIGVLISKSQRMDRVFLTCGVVGLESYSESQRMARVFLTYGVVGLDSHAGHVPSSCGGI
jgi:hypothetical protein